MEPGFNGTDRFRSIRYRLVVTSLAMSLSLVFLSSIANGLFLRHFARERAAQALESIASLVGYSASPGVVFRSTQAVEEALAGAFEIEDIRFAAVYLPDGSVLSMRGEAPARVSWKGIPLGVTITEAGDLLLAEAPIHNPSRQRIGLLQVGFSMKGMRDDLRGAAIFLLAAGLVLAGSAGLATWRFSARLTAPILALARAARSVADGSFERPLPIGTRDEVGLVAQSFNEMTARLEASYREIDRQNRLLEQKVRIRTAELRRKNAELAVQNERVLEMSRLKSAFLASMSHELRTPLNAILVLSEILHDEVMGPLSNEEQKKQIAMIHESGDNLLRLINDILDLSRIEAGRMEIRHAPTDLQRELRAACESMRRLVESKGLAYGFEAVGEDEIWADADRIRQVLLNLIGNAVKFCEQGSVKVRSVLDLRAEMLTVSVADTGIGIARENHERIFQEFRQVEETAARRFGGTGLGLAITQRLLHLMGGEIKLRSELGRGSTFTFQVPVYRRKPEKIEARAA